MVHNGLRTERNGNGVVSKRRDELGWPPLKEMMVEIYPGDSGFSGTGFMKRRNSLSDKLSTRQNWHPIQEHSLHDLVAGSCTGNRIFQGT